MFVFHLGQLGTRHKLKEVWQGVLHSKYLFMHFNNDFFIEVDGKRFEGKAGDFVLHSPEKALAHGAISEREGFINDWFFFSVDAYEEDFLRKMPFDRPVSGGNEKAFLETLSDILSENSKSDEFSNVLISNYIYKLLIILKRTENEELKTDNKIHNKFNDLRLHIHSHCNEGWTLEKMAEKLGYSVSHFCALYKQFFKVSPIDDLLDARLQLAKELIVLNNHKIGEIAKLCGFSSIHYFSEFFRKKTGKSPSDFYSSIF